MFGEWRKGNRDGNWCCWIYHVSLGTCCIVRTCASEDRYSVPLSWLKRLDDATATLMMQYAIEITNTPISAHHTREGRMVPFLVKRVTRGRCIFPTLNSLIGTLTLSWMGSMSPAFGLPCWLNSFFFLGWAGTRFHMSDSNSGWDGGGFDMGWKLEMISLDWVGHCTRCG